jgi:SAM-dependent methyltransferase
MNRAIHPGFGVENLLATYPRRRPPLGPELQARYVEEYRANRTGKAPINAIVLALEGWMHRQIALRGSAGSVLELGGGTLNHLPYERVVDAYDVVEPFEELWRHNPHRARVRRIYSDITDVPAANRYDRVISVAVLEHLTELPSVVARAALKLSPSGYFQAGIPSEGGFLWGLAWRSVTAPAFRLRTGLPYDSLMRHEHVNTAREIVAVVRHMFREVSIRRFPLPLLHGSFYTYLEARDVCEARCRSLAS